MPGPLRVKRIIQYVSQLIYLNLYDGDLCMCGTKETEIHVLFGCKCYYMVRRRWLRTWDVLEEKERIMDVIKGYVEVNDDVENETMKYLGEVWT